MKGTARLALLAALALPASARAGDVEGPVVRPQLYTASRKLELALVVGYVSNDPYERIIVPGGSVAYHFADHSALEFHGGYGLFSGKQLLSQINNKINRDPNVLPEPQFFVSANYEWAPIYGKINAFGEVILHYDLYVLAGVGVTSDQIETNTGGSPNVQSITTQVFPLTDVGIGQHFFLSKHSALRVEVRPYIFWQQINNQFQPDGDVEIVTGLSLMF